MKKIFSLLVLGAWLLAAAAPAVAAKEEGIAAVVNDSVITLTDVRDRAALYLFGAGQEVTPEMSRRAQQQALARLIDEALQLQEAGRLDVRVDDATVQAAFADVAGQNKATPDELRTRLQQGGVRVETLYAQIRAELSWSQVVRRRLRPQVSISESEIDQALDVIARSSGKAHYQVAEIFLKVESPAQDAAARDAMDQLLARLNKGESFAALARQYSQAPGAATGGDLGWIEDGQLDKPLDEALARLQPGQISPPLRSARGYHLLFLRDVSRDAAPFAVAEGQPESPAPAAVDKNDEKARTKVANSIGLQRLGQLADRYLRDLRATAFIDKRI